MNSEIADVLDSLGLKEDNVPLYHYYLPFLNLYWGDEGEEIYLERLRKLAVGVKDSPNFIKQLIRDLNWRSTLIGNTIVIILRAKEFQSDLIWRLENWSWVAPQLAVGVALLNDGLAEKVLQRIIENASEESNPKTIMSAYRSLRFLESGIANEFQQTKLFEVLKEKDAWDNSIKIAEVHWEYWKNVKPVN